MPFLVIARMFVVGALSAALTSPAWSQEKDAYDLFRAFCAEHFDAAKEPEVTRMFGDEVRFVDTGTWTWASETSACVAFETNLPTRSVVEFGPTRAYGRKTAEPSRYTFLHVHYLTGLEPGATVHYRMIALDARGKRVVSADATLKTPRLEQAVRIPGDLAGPPYVCDRPNTTYLLTKDITSDSTGINVVADGITLDLGGHTVIYENKPNADDPTVTTRGWGWHPSQKNCGVRTADGRRDIRIVNGVIRMGAGQGDGSDGGHNPVFLRRPRGTEVAGVTCEFAGTQVTGIRVMNAYEGVRVHHNVVTDRGTKIVNRHQGMDAIAFGIGKVLAVSRCDHNLILRTRHRGISTASNTELDHNEIYVDSFATNSYGIIYYNNQGASNLRLHHNRIFGTGFHPIGIGSGQGWSDVVVSENYIQMQGTKRDDRWPGGVGGGEDGTVGEEGFHPVNGIRLQRPRKNIVHENNTIVVRGTGEGCLMRGLWIVPDDKTEDGVVFRNNRIKLIVEDAKAEGYAVSCGGSRHEGTPISIEGNTVVTNLLNVRFSDNYSHGGKYRFVRNTFAKVAGDPRYRTIVMGYRGYRYPSFGHAFFDTTFEGEASFDSVSFEGARDTQFDFSVGYTLDITGAPGTMVRITDRAGENVFSGPIAADGKLAVPLLAWRRNAEGKTMLTPHTVNARGREVKITIDREQALDLKP